MKLDQLLKFCYKGEDRPQICHPFTQNGFTWATDGRILIRVPLIESAPEQEKPNINIAWHAYREDCDWIPINDDAIPQLKMVDCAGCDGEPADGYCEDCGGKGEYEMPESVQVGTRAISNKYLLLIASLPNCMISADGDKLSAAPFKFAGGCGLIMPMKVDQVIHVLKR